MRSVSGQGACAYIAGREFRGREGRR